MLKGLLVFLPREVLWWLINLFLLPLLELLCEELSPLESSEDFLDQLDFV